MSWLKDFNELIGSPDSSVSAIPILMLGLLMFSVTFFIFPVQIHLALYFLTILIPTVFPFILGYGVFHMWVNFRRSAFIASQKYILLEIKPPRSHVKTPLAMETALAGIHMTSGESTWYDRLILGKVRHWWSLEIAVIDGTVHFFIWGRAVFRHNAEAQIYAQIPGAQIVEVPDYTKRISTDSDEHIIWGCDFDLIKPDPYPIKTYVDYGLDKSMKEEEQIDPLAHAIEYMGTFGVGEQVWMQIIIRAHKGEKYHKKNSKGKKYTWKDEGKELVQKIREDTIVKKMKYKDAVTGEIREVGGFPNPTKGEIEAMTTIERNISKQAFDVGIRVIYIAEPDKFAGSKIPGIINMFKQFSSENFNGFKPARWFIQFNDYPWEIFAKKRKKIKQKEIIDAYRRRSYFYAPYITQHNIMSTEELATMYHIPSASITTPALSRSRVQSTTNIPPSDLPT